MRSRTGQFLIGGILLTSLAADIRWILRPRENWAAAARLLASHPGACIIYEPEQSRRFYTFFEPSLKSRACPPPPAHVIVAISPYSTSDRPPIRFPTQTPPGRIIYNNGPWLIEYP